MKSSINHKLAFADFSFLTLYEIPQKKKTILSPFLGFYVSLNQYVNLVHTTSLRGNGQINTQNIPEVVLDYEGEPFLVYVGINTGVAYDIFIFNRNVEFNIIYYLSPMDLFSSDFIYEANYEEESIKGKFHSIAIGLNIPITKK